jgi:ADP-ribose pyrophosphatase YjhB (NUDIX family)
MATPLPEIHVIQGRILRELLFHPNRRFSELAPEGVPSDQLAFHVKRLAELNLIHKIGDRYELSTEGKEFANRFDADTVHFKIEWQAKIGASVTCVKNGKYLIQQRLKQPFYGFHGFITGKIKWGETTAEGAARELAEETGLTADLVPVGIIHKIDYSLTGELLEDKYFFAFRGEKPKGNFIEQFEGGRNMWLTKDELLKMPDLYADVTDAFKLFEGKKFRIIERRYTEEKY